MFGMMGINMNDACCGARHESQLEGYSEEIKSKNITVFSYCSNHYASYFAKIEENGKLTIACSGGGQYNRRDGSLYGIRYETDDLSILKSLQDVIDKYNLTKGNGYCTHVDGLPPGIGDTFDVEYDSKEKIYKYSNQFPTMHKEADKEIDKIFHDFVKKDGYDFNTAGSNLKLFDDADKEYLQGTWKGTHFGDEIVATFNGDKVTITVDGKITDDNVEYSIYEGFVKTNEVKDGVEEVTRHYDYKEFNALDSFAKKNYFTMVAYFTSESGASSTCDMHDFDKPKPKEED